MIRAPDPELHRLYERLHGGGDDALDAARELRAHAAQAGREVVVVSACLLGERTRYDGGDTYVPSVVDPLLDAPDVIVVPLCPEILGGMGCPRPAVQFAVGDGDALLRGEPARVVDASGTDHTAALDRGAERADRLAALAGATRALLKERSPSCGTRAIHRPDRLIQGRGAFAARLVSRGLPIASEEDARVRDKKD